MLGFIVELHMCPHIPSCERNALLPTVGKECVHVYFFGSVASWPPVLSVVIEQCVTITGLQRKLILVGPEKNEHFLFVAKKSSLVSQLSPSGCVPMDCGGKEPCFRAREKDPSTSRVKRANIHKELPCDSKEGARIGSYIEIVTDIPMSGQLVELNKQAWLLLTHYNVSQLHGLCVGAMVAVRHVHIMVLDSAGEKGLVLGACFRSHASVAATFKKSSWNTFLLLLLFGYCKLL
ncbi:hypothetical protein BDL97_08G043200 [Sphagnum fallax]|nr:hypothetical protein BDL97_08G043200 [Sphagnum fallax]